MGVGVGSGGWPNVENDECWVDCVWVESEDLVDGCEYVEYAEAWL